MTAADAPDPPRQELRSEGFELHGERGDLKTFLRDVWRSRELVTMLARKNFIGRYRRASMGLLWVAALPLFQTTILAIVFSEVVKLEVGGPYPVFLFSGMLGWQFFSLTVSSQSTAIVDGTALSNRIYFPRLVHVLAGVRTGLYGVWINALIVLGITVLYDVGLGPDVLWFVPGVILSIGLATSLSMVLSAIHVYFRDIRYLVTAVIQPLFYLTPVLYPLAFAPNELRWLIRFNPATGPVVLFRAATFGEVGNWLMPVWISLGWLVVLGVAAVWLQLRYDRVFVDLL